MCVPLIVFERDPGGDLSRYDPDQSVRFDEDHLQTLGIAGAVAAVSLELPRQMEWLEGGTAASDQVWRLSTT
jgi:hypothetical protein